MTYPQMKHLAYGLDPGHDIHFHTAWEGWPTKAGGIPAVFLFSIWEIVMKVVEMMKSFWKEEEGLTMVEYALVGALVVVGAIAAFRTLGTNVATKSSALAQALT
jgi:pilus assembly protein Flp/PilA